MKKDQLNADFEELGLNSTSDFNEVKAAFRRAALQFHPDQGGQAEKFIRVHAAYRRLCKHFGGKSDGIKSDTTEPVDELIEHLSQFDAAIDSIREGLIEDEHRWDLHIRESAIRELIRAQSCSEVDSVMKRIIRIVSRDLISEITQNLGIRVEAVASNFNGWMLSWLTPYYETIRKSHAKKWWRSRSAFIMSMATGTIAAWFVVHDLGFWKSLIVAHCGALLGWLLAYPMHLIIGNLRYRVEVNVPNVEKPLLRVSKTYMDILKSKDTDEQFTAAGGLAGLYALGPWGALAGVILGAIAGEVFGQKVDERRQVALEQINTFVPRACHQIRTILIEQIDKIALQMRSEIIQNYRTARQQASSCAYLLPPIDITTES